MASELRSSEFQNWENLRFKTHSTLVPEFGPKKSRPLYVDNSLLNFMPYVPFIVKQMKCTLTRRGIARISADALFFTLQKSWSWNPCSRRQSIAPSVGILYLHILYIADILKKKIKSKILMRCKDFMAQVNYCKRGQGPCEFNLPVQQEQFSWKNILICIRWTILRNRLLQNTRKLWCTSTPETCCTTSGKNHLKHRTKNTYLILASIDIQE